MATMHADQAFDYRDLDLHKLIANQTAFEFSDNVYETKGGITYEDVASFEHFSGRDLRSSFGGSGITFNSDYSKVTAGTVTGVFEEYRDGTAWVNNWMLQGISYSAMGWMDAIRSASTADDYAAIASMLAGDDTISLSPFADMMRGYGGDDAIDGNAGDDLLRGDAGNDTLDGGAGNDILDGGSGDDTMIGGFGGDTYVVDSALDRTIDLSTFLPEIDTVEASLTWALGANLERLVLTGSAAIDGTGNALANTLIGNAAANVLSGGRGGDLLDGGLGNDTLIGGLGNDTYVVDAAGDVITEISRVATEIDTVRSPLTWTLGANLEGLVLTGSAAIDGTGNALANTLIGNAAANVLSGGRGDDTLNGGLGNDTLIGGLGNDTYVVNAAGDVITEISKASTEIDTVLSSVRRVLGSNLENLTLTGKAAIDGSGNELVNTLTGNSAANTLTAGASDDVLYGGRGNDTLNGGFGGDAMAGGLGNDTYIVDSAGDVVTEKSKLASEIDTVRSSVSWTLGANLEHLTLTGSSAIRGTGNALANSLTGNAAANVLDGGLRDDALRGGSGNDTLIGGLGNDRLTGGPGLDTFRFNGVPNTATNTDIITDFLAADDRIQLNDAAFVGIGPVGALAEAAFYAGSAAHDASDRIIYNQAAGKLYFDADGNGAGAQVLFATVTAGTTLTVADVFIV